MPENVKPTTVAANKPPKRTGPLPVKDRNACLINKQAHIVLMNEGPKVFISVQVEGQHHVFEFDSQQITQDFMNVFVNARRAQLQAKGVS